jgi:hypothetical protein
MPVTTQNLADVFSYHAPDEAQIRQYADIRASAKGLAAVILLHTPPCADQQAALRLLRECVMTANAAIALKGAV